MIDNYGRLHARLTNWGYWLHHEADIAPPGARCISLESRHVPEAGEVWDDCEPRMPAPDVPDAEAMQELIRELDHMQQYALAVIYGGTPCVMRFRRVGEHNMDHSIKMAELLLHEMLKKMA